jgi:hypothetical protein
MECSAHREQRIVERREKRILPHRSAASWIYKDQYTTNSQEKTESSAGIVLFPAAYDKR